MGPAPDFVERIGAEVASEDPPAYASQSKPKGRKAKAPKKGQVYDEAGNDDHAHGWDENGWDEYGDSTWDAPAEKKASKKPVGKKRKLLKKGKASPTGKGKKSTPKSKKGKKTKPVNEPTDADADGAADEENQPPEVAVPKRKPRAKRAARPKAKAAPVAPVAPGPSLERGVLPDGLVYPPDWVRSGNVYSNMYRQAKSSGKSLEEVKTIAREAGQRFRETGGVEPSLLPSFGAEPRGQRRKKGDTQAVEDAEKVGDAEKAEDANTSG